VLSAPQAVLVGPVAVRYGALIEAPCAKRRWTIRALAIQPDHLLLFATEVVKECKGLTSFALRKKFPHLLPLPAMWTRSYFASTADNASQETNQRSIAAQTGR
jgi:putative transposase